ncbi:competence protein ComEA helix-hairpin-helix repeat region [bacterium A37T11]|nr:competence protein ComEA helix-hairpin-helix repeat region [bacterium A37T11]
MRRWCDELFGFSRKELQGLLVLVLVLILTVVGPPLYRWLVPPETIDMAIYDQEITQFLASADSTTRYSPATQQEALPKPAYFVFNPNQLPISAWKRLGLSDRQIKNIKNYEAKGGVFRRKDDLKKIYSLTEADFAHLEPYIQIPEKTATHPADKSSWQPSARWQQPTHLQTKAKDIPILEINSADSLSLQALPGIGPVFAARISKFRDRLGGFYALPQLLSVYGMDSIRYAGIAAHLHVDSSLVKKININEATYEELNAHPFISPKQANAIVQYRKQHGIFRHLKDLKNIVVIDQEFMEKAAPYLKK